jgi:putative pyruvate formate lyase activating enzyme
MDQYHPDDFCAPGSARYRPQYAEIVRRPAGRDVCDATFEKRSLGHPAAMPGT